MAEYPIPPWLVPKGDPARDYISGFQVGAQLSEASARLKQQADIASMEAQVSAENARQRALREEHQIAVTQAYHQAQIGMEQSRLAEMAKANATRMQQAKLAQDFKVQQAALQFQAQQRTRARIAAGEDPIKVGMEELPGQGAMTGLAALSRAKAATIPKGIPQLETVEKGGETYYWGGGTRGFTHVPKVRPTAEGTITQQERARIAVARDELKELRKKFDPDVLASMDKSTSKARRDTAADVRKQMDDLRQEIQSLLGRSSGPAARYDPKLRRIVRTGQSGGGAYESPEWPQQE